MPAADGIAFELHALGADRLGQLVEEGVPLLVDVLRGVLRLHGLEAPVGMLDDEAVGDQSLQRVGDVEVDADAEARREILLDGRVDVGDVLAPRALLRQHAVEQHLFLDVLLGGAGGEFQHDAAVVGHGVEVEVLRHHHHVALLLVHEVHALAEGDAAEADHGPERRDRVRRQQRDLAGGAEQRRGRGRRPPSRPAAACRRSGSARACSGKTISRSLLGMFLNSFM